MYRSLLRDAPCKVRGGSISARSTLVIDGEDIIVDGLVLDGALIVKAVAGASVRIVSAQAFPMTHRDPGLCLRECLCFSERTGGEECRMGVRPAC